LRTRQPSLPPRHHQGNRIRFLAPTDGEAGGTWIAVNEYGLSLCLLNDYRSTAQSSTADFTSRGLLVRDLVQATDFETLRQLWPGVALQRFRPFKILALVPGQEARLYGWNGDRPSLEKENVKPPLCSSSFDDSGAARSRANLLEDFSVKPDLEPRKRHLRFHQSHLPEKGPYSVCMHRPDAVTVSFTLVEVDPAGVSMAYAHGAPCAAPLEHLVTLDRVQ
jgi:hypothetical protein